MNNGYVSSHTAHRTARALALGGAVALLAACVTEPPPRGAPPPGPPAPVVNTTVYAYPQKGQTPEQVDRDRYDCYVWATQQTGFDPSSASVPPEMRVRVVEGPPPGTGTAIGAVTGAVLGAAVAGPWNRGPGAVVGAIIGGAVGSSADAANAQRAREARMYDRGQLVRLQQQAADYRRALSACLEGRGYSVR